MKTKKKIDDITVEILKMTYINNLKVTCELTVPIAVNSSNYQERNRNIYLALLVFLLARGLNFFFL